MALDDGGRLAAATSTGGTFGKLEGRVGDTPLIGSGTWADDRIAVSCTGVGEYFIRACAAASVATRYRAGEVLWREREPSDGMLVVVSGVVACTHTGNRADTRYEATGLLGAIDVLSADKRWATARAETDVRGLRADREVILDVLEDNFELAVNLLGFIAHRTLSLREARTSAPSSTS